MIDISQPDAPSLVGTMPSASGVREVALDDRYAYLACRENGLQVAWQQCSDAPASVAPEEVPITRLNLTVTWRRHPQ